MMHKMILLVVGLLGLAGVGSAQIVQTGQCDTITLMNNFVLNTFATGTWYEIGKSTTQNADCSSLQFATNTDGTIAVTNSTVVNNFLQTASGTVTQTTGTAQLTLTLSGTTTPVPFWILGSDYTNYAIAINCVNVGTTQRQLNVWQLGRAVNTFDTAVNLNAANTLLSAVSLSVTDLISIDHSTAACTQLPVIGAGQPVILDGQCATASIPVVQNFDVVAFTGIWHEISSYYSVNAVGTCARANYTLVDSTVNVVNSQVLNQQLDTISGVASLIGTDQSGRLSVVLNVQGVLITQELLVIGTDYTGYAVSYSCVNINANQRQVTSWILSRTRTISATSQTAVNAVIASLVDLNEVYYQTTDQSDEGCFYFPTYVPGVAVEFPGLCDDTIAAVPNFNLAQFVGTWHEIEAYPKVQQTGTCVNHAFSTSTTTNTLNLVSNQVVDQSAIVANGNVVISSSDASGRLTLTLTTSGQTITIPYWILATDYNNYALAYSCVNLENDNRAVYSWKLSRTQTLSAASVTAINTAITAVQVLEQQYFETVDQTDAGCFYYPTAQPGVPVVFPGQCDTTIPVQANFDPTLYTGLWHDIESYPSAFQFGTCNNAYYTLEGGVVDVYNTQVVNQQLDTINGTAIIPDATQPAKLLVTFPVGDTTETVDFEYWILSTDYTSYSLVYSCFNLPDNQRMVYSWKLSRSKALTPAAVTAINAVTATIPVLESQYYVAQDQTAAGCFYFPEPQAGEPVIFPGECDNTIAAVPNFNLAQFVGTWHEIEAYPKVQQTGTCVNHAFSTSTTTNTLNLVSNQVVDQSAIAANGNVVISSTDASGRLTLTLTTSGQTITIPYWILATDYNNYALAYSCVNLENDNRAVYSWKLSRTQTLSAASVTAINTAMTTVQVLEQQYFETVDQTDAGCFYYPTAQPGVPVVFPGQCDTTIPVQANFDPTLYTGLWHDIESYPSAFQFGTCNNAYYTLEGGVVDVYNTQVVNQQLDTINGTAIIPDATQPAKLLVTFPVGDTTETVDFEYWILSTDYTSYSLVYSCFNLPDNQRMVYSWKLSRSKALTPAAVTAINAVTATIPVLESQYYVAQDQTAAGCFYFPEPQAGEPVIFPGECDNTIAAVPNFNLAQFVGIWHEIEAYPKVQQTGTCVNHAFSTSTTTNTLNLVSNQVVDQLAVAANGNVVISSTDGSGRLTLTLTTSGQTITIPYWILATDYNNYALAYSCVNLENDNRAVYSWKLSRTQTLSAVSVTAINTAMTAVQVLEQQYFETVDQTDAGCFYYPTAQPGVPVVFPGQCDTTIPVQANFDPTLYTGLWHDIESYPSTFQYGTCNNAYYTLVGGVVDVYNTQVVNQQLDTINGTAIIPDATQPAKLLVTFPVGDTTETVDFEYWILSTDYTSYSLVYSCFNLPSNQRMVYSWKLSRSKALTPAAVTAINAVTATIPVLESQYYVAQDQTAAGCFYFPEPQAGQPVIFPGECDNTIAAVPNFNLAQFVGTWHEIETYPKPQQTGTCVNHAFSASTTANTLNLVSNQVVDQLATSSSGTVTVVSTDASGRLTLTLNVNGLIITIPYWILATDYTSYALVYSCMDIENDRRAVYSWKLSRSQTLPAAAVTPINNAIAAVNVLGQEYYEDVDQSTAACFSYPNIPAGDPIILEGQCGTVTPVTNFQSAAFSGNWFETARYASARQTGNCAASQFTTTAQNTFTLTQTIVYNERQTIVSGTATLATDGSGTLTATLSDGAGLTYTTTLHILDTDYTTFALLYSCENVPGSDSRQIYSWQLSRTQSGLSQAAIDRISQVISNNVDLLAAYYQPTGQSSADCFYYPVYEETPEAIILPGTCPSVSGVASFNPSLYIGDWYDVGRYPIDSQFGSCPIAEYTLVDGVITIRNTMVQNETLFVQNAIARLSSGGTGLLTVTIVFDNGDESVAQYFILGTDYSSYSVVYSCRNLGDGTRQVLSWILSRTPTLTTAAIAAVNNIISNTQGLLQEYYQPQSHSDQDCFYVPEPVPGEPVLFRGGCAAVTGMQGFNPSQYLGWWHEIERYPSDNNAGQCTSANYVQSSANAIIVIETDVFNGVANETTNVAVISADGTITITRNGVSTVYTVIVTDYNSYSLLYACEEVVINSNIFRRVWSAKHSKARSLTTAAQNAMSPSIEANPVLHQNLYELVNQSDDACFHYREDASEQVILPGQCDTSIPVQTNFDISEFAGTWYQIERYPYPQVSNDGTCIGTRYTVNGDTVTVLNWEVLNGELNTREGTATVNGATLTVTLPVEGSDETVTSNLQILATDNEDYALAYTCVNINTFQRAVGAFKLSRTRRLTNDGQYAIETYMAGRQEFHQPYFISISHHDECEEPSSALLVKSSIIVMLVCVVLQLVM